MTFTRLKLVRQKRGVPQKVIADHIGIHRSNYSLIESGIQRLTAEQLLKFCQYFHVSADYILELKEKENGDK